MQSKNDVCRMSHTEEVLNNLPFWPSLTEQEKETIRRSAFVRHYRKGAFVHSSDNECLGMLFVLSGEIRAYLLSDEGREVTLFRLYPGEPCVLSAPCVINIMHQIQKDKHPF